MSSNDSESRTLRDFSNVEKREYQEIIKRRRYVLKMQLHDPGLVGRIDQLAISKKNRKALKEYLNNFREKDSLSDFEENLRQLTSSIRDSDQALVNELFGDLLSQQEVQTPKTVGLALSGGGIRSAAFNLGVLQATSNKQFLKCVDYLSTVSGGGYIGSSLTWFLQQKAGEDFPFARTEKGRQRVEWIRRHASYLTPGDGLNVWALAAAGLRGILMNLFILVPLWLLIIWVLTLGVPHVAEGKKTFWTSQLLHFLGENHWSVAVAIFVSMVLVWLFRKANDPKTDKGIDPKTGNDMGPETGSKKMEVWWMRLLLWAIVVIAATQIPGEGLAEPWTDYPWYFLALPPLVVVLVFGAIYTAMKVWSGKEAIRPRAKVTEFIEISAWAIVFWILYVLIPSALFEPQSLLSDRYPPAFIGILAIGIILLSKLLVNYVFFSVLSVTKLRLRFPGHRYFSVQYGDLLGIGALCVIVGLIPLVDYYLLIHQGWLKDHAQKILGSMSIGGAISTVLGWLNKGRTDERRGYVALLLRAGLVLLITSAVLVTYRWAAGSHSGTAEVSWALIVAWVLLFVILVNADINYVSMHRYYRNRLLEAFLFPEQPGLSPSPPEGSKSDNLDLCEIDIGATGAPYHLINTNLVTVGSRDNKMRLRMGDSFIFSPQFIGSKATGWVHSEFFRKMNLATALAISGAAVDPNTGVSRSWPLRIIMTWLNVRLGYWCENPNDQTVSTGLLKVIRSSWLWLIAKEMFGQPHERWSFVRLSDGGHFENLGLYELVRRRCSLIVISDAGADPEFKFSDLARALERIRVDFGVEIDGLRTHKITPKAAKRGKQADNEEMKKELKFAESPFAVGEIVYDQEKNERGLLVYLKTTLFPGLNEDIMGYARQHKDFPDESTANQFFTEEQFEAYRELGYRAMGRVLDANKDKMRQHMIKYLFF
jgi:hypothetical protein